MAQVYVNLLYAGKRVWTQIPSRLRDKVRAILVDDVEKGFITTEYYKEIVRES